MIKYKWVPRNVKVIDKVTCNKCGLETQDESRMLTYQPTSYDGIWESAHLCEKCYNDITASFVIKPEKETDDNDDDDDDY